MATKGMGTKFNIGTEDSKKTVAELTEIGGMELSADTIEVTTLDSADGYREFMQGLKDAGEVSLSGYFNPTTGKGQKELYDLFEGGELTDFEIEFPESLGAKWGFKGILTAISTSAPMEDNIPFEASIKVSGKPTLTIS